MMSFAQVAVERVLNSLPEGILIAICAYAVLRLMGRQNSGTRFAVWLVALAGVVALPFLSGFGLVWSGLPATVAHIHSQVTIPAFWALAFFILWVLIATLALARVIAGVWQVRQIRRSCTEIAAADLDPSLHDLLADTKRPVRLLSSENARVPAALGFWNPAIVLPAWTLRELSADDLQPILVHELSHLRRHDDWTNLLQKAIRAVLFFHPAVWWIDARLSLEREMACDDAVLAATGNARAYAGCLIDLLERGCSRRGWTMAQAAVARARDASVRIARILRVGASATTRVGRGALAVAASLAVACAGIALCAPQFVEFVPMESTSAAQLSAPSLGEVIHTRAAAVIPASFHPDQKSASARTARHSNLRAASIRRAAARSHVAKSPLVMAKLPDQSTDPKPPAIAARLIAADASDPMQPMPLIVVFETRETSAIGLTPVQLRTVAAGPEPNTQVQQLQSTEDPALQLQIYQAIDPATGAPVQVLRIVLTVPQQPGTPSQSI